MKGKIICFYFNFDCHMNISISMFTFQRSIKSLVLTWQFAFQFEFNSSHNSFNWLIKDEQNYCYISDFRIPIVALINQ